MTRVPPSSSGQPSEQTGAKPPPKKTGVLAWIASVQSWFTNKERKSSQPPSLTGRVQWVQITPRSDTKITYDNTDYEDKFKEVYKETPSEALKNAQEFLKTSQGKEGINSHVVASHSARLEDGLEFSLYEGKERDDAEKILEQLGALSKGSDTEMKPKG